MKYNIFIFSFLILITLSNPAIGEINFIDPTPANGSTIYVDHTTINASTTINALVVTSNLTTMIWNWNGTNSTFLNEACVLHLSFDNNSAIGDNTTVAVDVSGRGNNGSFVNGSTGNWTTDGKWNGAMNFDGVDDYVDCGGSNLIISDNTNITISCWAKYTTLHSGTYVENRLFSLMEGFAATNIGLGITESGHIAGFTRNGLSPTEFVGGSVGVGWNHFSLVKNGANHQLYLNGVFSGSSISYTPTNQPDSHDALIGVDYSAGNRFFNGSIDAVSVDNFARSPTEVRQSYLSNLWKYNESRWYFETTQTNLPIGDYNYQIFANNVSSEYRILKVNIPPPASLLEELKLILSEITTELSDINMSNYLVYAFVLIGILLIILGIQIITNNIYRG